MSEDIAPRRLIWLDDPETGASMEMEVYLEMEVDGLIYALLVPMDLPAFVYRQADAEGGFELVEGKALTQLRKHVGDALKDWSIKAELRDGDLWLVGDPPDAFFEDCEGIEAETEDGPEEFAVLVQLETGDETYLVATPVVPELVPARLDAGRSRPLTDDELADLEETFRAALAQFDEEDDDFEQGR